MLALTQTHDRDEIREIFFTILEGEILLFLYVF